MKKNEAVNFGKQYKSTICLNNHLRPVKIVDYTVDTSEIYFLIQEEGGEKKEIPSTYPLIPLKGRLKSRDYDFIEATFYKTIHN